MPNFISVLLSVCFVKVEVTISKLKVCLITKKQYVTLSANWYQLLNVKNVKNTHGYFHQSWKLIMMVFNLFHATCLSASVCLSACLSLSNLCFSLFMDYKKLHKISSPFKCQPWSIALKQFVGFCFYLSVSNHFVGLALTGLRSLYKIILRCYNAA